MTLSPELLAMIKDVPASDEEIAEWTAQEGAYYIPQSRLIARIVAERKAGTWQPIETAPKDGTPFLAWQVVIADEFDEDDRLIAKGVRTEQTALVQYFLDTIVQIPWSGGIPTNVSYTHWMQTPATPALSALELQS